MKILQTPPRYAPYIGGVENYCRSLSEELVSLGHEVSVLCANEPSTRNETINKVQVKRLGYVGKIANTNVTLSLPFKLMHEDFDVIHAHLPTPWSADWSGIVSRIKNKPLVVTYHNDITGKGINKYIAGIYNSTFLKFLLNRADKIIVTNKKYAGYSPYLKKYREKIIVIPPGVDLNKYRSTGKPKNKNTLFFLGILDEYHEYKGLDDLLKGILYVKKEIPGIKLIIGGEGRLKDKYIAKAKELGIQDNVEFAGFIPEEEKAGYYSQAEAFILPSTSKEQEGFGMVLLEAMACGTPVIASEVVGLADEIRENRAGLIVAPKNPEKLSETITFLLRDENLKKQTTLNAKKLIEENYSWKKTAKKTEETYKTLA